MLAWLGLHPAARREALAATFWGETDDTHARQSLRQALASIRKAAPDLLVTSDELVSVAPGALTLDVVEFERRAAEGDLAGAVDLWKGDLLPFAEDLGTEPFRTWLESERARLRARLAGVLQRLAAGSASLADQVAWSERWSQLLPLDERAHIHLLGALERSGRAGEALERHAEFAARYRADTGRDLPAAIREAVEVLHRSPAPATQHPGSAAFFTPDLIGRDGELAALNAAWSDARGAGGVVVLIEGEAGVGRTRLCTELARAVARRDRALVLETPRGCEGADWTPARRFLSPLAAAPGLAASAPWALAELAPVLPEIAERWTLPVPQRGADLAGAINDAIASVAEEVPILVLVDDAPDLCTELRPAISQLVRRMPPNVLLVLTAEPGGLVATDCGRAFREASDGRRVKLQALDENQVEVMVASMVPIAASDRQRLAALLMAETEGNPLRVSECLSAFADASVLSIDRNGLWRLSKGRGPASLPLPPSVVRTRLERLSPEARRTIEAAARHPRIDARELVTASGLDEEEIEAALGELVGRRLVRPVRDSSLYEIGSETVRAAVLATAAPPAPQLPSVSWRRRRRMAVTGIAVLGIAVAGLAARSALPANATAEPDRVIVFALENLTGAPDPAATGRIVAEAVIQAIGRVGTASAVPLVAAAAGPGSRPNALRKAARAAGAALAVVGSYQQVGDTLVFTARIVDVATGKVRAVARDARGPATRPAMAMQAFTESVVGALSAWLDRRIAAATSAGSVPPTHASYRAFAEGLDFLYAREGERANPAFFSAYRLDTTYLLPLLYAAFTHDGQGRFAVVDSLVGVLEPKRATMTSYEQATLDYLRLITSGNLAARYDAARRAAEAAPGSMMAGYYFPRAAIALNRPREAIAALDAVNPERDEIAGMPGYWSMLSMALHMAGEYERQLAMGRAVEARFPKDTRGLNYQIRALAALGSVDTLDAILSRGFLVATAPGWDALGLSLHMLAFDELRAHGHDERALPLLERAVAYYATAPDSLQRVPRQRLEMARALLRVGRLADARRMAEGLVREEGVRGEVLIAAHSLIGVAAAASGDEATARAQDQWLAGAGTRFTFGGHTEARARIAAVLGQRDEAVRLLHQAVTEGLGYENNKHRDFELQRLRGYPPFEAWLRPKG